MFGFFKKRETAEPTDPHEEADAETAMFIQQKAQVGAMFGSRINDPQEDGAAQLAHYQRIRDDLIAHLETIRDDFCREFAAHQIIKMLTADDEQIARALLLLITDEGIRDRVLEQVPALRLSRMNTPPVPRPD